MTIDRLSIRKPPHRLPVMYQNWGKLLFMHWQIPVVQLRPLIPPRLEIDTFDGIAWIGIIPFTMWGIRPPFFPPLPGLSSSHELNVRTYVHIDGVPGIWFLSLDANNTLAVLGARMFYGLPYYLANMNLQENGPEIRYASTRKQGSAPEANFQAVWTRETKIPETKPGTLDFFLTERYCLYTLLRGELYRCRINHRPWPLRAAQLVELDSTMLQSHSLEHPQSDPLLHAQAEPLHVKIYALEKV